MVYVFKQSMFAGLKFSMKQISTITFFLLAIFSASVLLSSCANMIPPGGGPRDSLPPVLVMSSPKDSALNVKTKDITLTFDEYISLENPMENILISPNLKSVPLFDYKLRNVTIKLKDTLEPNTTYAFDFGESIKDVNEGNIARGFHYAFSTGNKLDTYTYSGKVIVAETGKTDSTLWAILHKDLSDTAVYKSTPRYFTRINGKGEFTFKNLPEGKFAAYIVASKFSKKYDDSTRLFAFLNNPVTINANTATDTLYAFQEFREKEKTVTANAQIRPSANAKEDKRLRYTVGLDNGKQDLLTDMTFSFNRKLTVFDSSHINLYDTAFRKLTGYTILLDSSKTKLIVQNKWKQNTQLRIIIPKDALADSSGITLTKADTIRFITKSEADYGSIRLRFSNLDMLRNPVLQISSNDKLIESVKLSQTDFYRKLFAPGSFDLRILFDNNKNGIWDTGHFGTKQQPEIVQRITRPINIRANWDNEINISL